MRKAEDKEKAATVKVDNKVMEESLAVAGGRCRKRVLLRALQVSGEINVCFSWKIKFLEVFSPEALVLPVITLVCISAYTVAAIYYYNMDD